MLKVAGSSAGRLISQKTRDKLKLAAIARNYIGENNPMFGLSHSKETRAKIALKRIGRKLSESTRAKISAKLSGENHPLFGKTLSKETKEKITLALKKHEIKVIDLETNSETDYPSIRGAARALDIRSVAIDNYLKYIPKNPAKKKPYRSRYIFKLLNRSLYTQAA
jgi:group I intron endonuclease